MPIRASGGEMTRLIMLNALRFRVQMERTGFRGTSSQLIHHMEVGEPRLSRLPSPSSSFVASARFIEESEIGDWRDALHFIGGVEDDDIRCSINYANGGAASIYFAMEMHKRFLSSRKAIMDEALARFFAPLFEQRRKDTFSFLIFLLLLPTEFSRLARRRSFLDEMVTYLETLNTYGRFELDLPRRGESVDPIFEERTPMRIRAEMIAAFQALSGRRPTGRMDEDTLEDLRVDVYSLFFMAARVSDADAASTLPGAAELRFLLQRIRESSSLNPVCRQQMRGRLLDPLSSRLIDPPNTPLFEMVESVSDGAERIRSQSRDGYFSSAFREATRERDLSIATAFAISSPTPAPPAHSNCRSVTNPSEVPQTRRAEWETPRLEGFERPEPGDDSPKARGDRVAYQLLRVGYCLSIAQVRIGYAVRVFEPGNPREHIGQFVFNDSTGDRFAKRTSGGWKRSGKIVSFELNRLLELAEDM